MIINDSFIISGGRPVKGEVVISGAKNVALKLVIASLLFDEPIYLANIPQIKDVEVLMDLLNYLGAKSKFYSENKVVIDGTNLKKNEVNLIYGSKIRVSFMFFAPLIFRFGEAKIPNPGGCRIGGRPIDRSIQLLQSFGIKVIYDDQGYYHAKLSSKTIKGSYFKFPKPSHTGTELAILLGVLAEGESVIDNASLEPEIDDLINFLNQSGGKIKRRGRQIIIKGVKKLHFTKEYSIIGDRNEAVTYAIFGLATKGWVRIFKISPSLVEIFIEKVKKTGGKVKIEEKSILFSYDKKLKATHITTKPHPGFMTDWQAPWAVLMTQAEGVSTIHETVFEGRFAYVDELKKLGAKIEFFQPSVKFPEKIYQFNLSENNLPRNPQAIRIFGPQKLHNGVLNVTDLRAGASLLIAAAVAEGESVINGVSIIRRGYEKIEEKLEKIGVLIKKI